MQGVDRRRVVAGLALAGSATAATGWARTGPSAAQIAETCQPLTGLNFTDAEQHQMLGMIDDIVERARATAALDLNNALPPAELFDPRLPGWQATERALARRRPPVAPPIPRDAESIAFAPAWQLSQWIAGRKISCRALTDIYLNRIALYGPKLECIATAMADRAREQADLLDRELWGGKWRGPLHGLPYGLKDLIDVAGVRTAWGAAPYRNRVADSDATIVERLREAGAVLLAKTTCGAIAYGDIWYGGRTRNPWNIEEGSSGSSAGSASAVAAGLCAFAIGTETMGSIVAPSARCGTVGLRPTFGRVPRTGAMALCWSLDKVGVLARDAADMADVLEVFNGSDGVDPCAVDAPLAVAPAVDPRETRLGYRPEWFAQGLETDRAALDAARQAGFQLVEIDLPDIDLNLLGSLVVTEAAAAFETLTASGQDDLMTWQDDIAWPNSWRAMQFQNAVGYVQAQRVRRQLMIDFATTMEGVDAILHPNDAGGLLAIGNHCGYPALVLPTGTLEQPTRTGFASHVATGDIPQGAALHKVPYAVTLTGKLFDEPALLEIGARISEKLALGPLIPPMGAR